MGPNELAETLLEQVARTAAARSALPESTYRLQFHAGFTFRDALAIAPYLRDLGITHCYASPYLKARPGSTHGYDIVDHGCLNPEIGTEDDYEAMVAGFHEHGLGQILDTVPNHMGVGANDNAWWNDVLENGANSRHGACFDISWRASPRPELQDKVLLPVLGDPYGIALEAGQLRLAFADGAFFIHYYERRFPLAPRTYADVLGHRLDDLELDLGRESHELIELQSILTAVRNLPERTETDPEKTVERQREKEVIKRRLAALTARSDSVGAFIERNVEIFNGRPGAPRSFDLLDNLLEGQCYRLAYWRVASDEINYRRFFDINDLAALSMEREEVFEAAHGLIFRLLAEGKVDGLRIDHPDGLYDPLQYFRRLQEQYALARARSAFEASGPGAHGLGWKDVEEAVRERIAAGGGSGAFGPPLYVIVEKILGPDEALVDSWPVHGTSGYDFLNQVNGLFVNGANASEFSRLYHGWAQDDTPYQEVVYLKKMLIMQVSLSSELHMLADQLDRLAQKSRSSRDFTFNTLRQALQEVIAAFPVYRSYIDDDGASAADRLHIVTAIRRATLRDPLMSRRVFFFIRDILLREAPESFGEEDRAEQRRFAGKFQQVTAPVTAKGVEDTAFYVYNRLVSLNEVGGDPGRFGVSPEALHVYNQGRQARWPHALSPLATHDAKRGEDVRARINVLSEMIGTWWAAVERWSRFNDQYRKRDEDQTVPDPNEEYLLYQTLVGAWPLGPLGPEARAEFVLRIQDYMIKALHEAKTHTSWINPNAEYDDAIREFVARILDEETNRGFLEDFQGLQRQVSHYGLFNSLSQTLLRLTAPGVPDTYQGTELWDFSLVDPDNRRPVDYAVRREMLRRLRADERGLLELARDLVASKEDGRIKLYVVHRALQARRDRPGLFTSGAYVPLAVEGAKSAHLFAFARESDGLRALVAAPRLLAGLAPGPDHLPLGPSAWGDVSLVLAGVGAVSRWRNVFTGERLSPTPREGRPVLAASDLFAHFPVALLLNDLET